jgi:hypothetical protein
MALGTRIVATNAIQSRKGTSWMPIVIGSRGRFLDEMRAGLRAGCPCAIPTDA